MFAKFYLCSNCSQNLNDLNCSLLANARKDHSSPLLLVPPIFLLKSPFLMKLTHQTHLQHTSNTPPTHLQHTSAAHRSELRAILFASSSKPYCLQKVEIKFILMLLLRSALARCVVGVFLISQLHAWTTFLPLLLHF